MNRGKDSTAGRLFIESSPSGAWLSYSRRIPLRSKPRCGDCPPPPTTRRRSVAWDRPSARLGCPAVPPHLHCSANLPPGQERLRDRLSTPSTGPAHPRDDPTPGTLPWHDREKPELAAAAEKAVERRRRQSSDNGEGCGLRPNRAWAATFGRNAPPY